MKKSPRLPKFLRSLLLSASLLTSGAPALAEESGHTQTDIALATPAKTFVQENTTPICPRFNAIAVPWYKYGGIVMDADTGEVLYEDRADKQLFPASLTKMMTLYLLFEELEAGRIKLDDTIPISKTAAAQEPSKLDLDPGETITVQNAILSLVTKSANDIAVAVAEKIGGSERNFASMMNAKACELGMTKTQFRNASGLPDRRQMSTARDMARLSQALIHNFPDRYAYFSVPSFEYGEDDYRNHNTLMNRFDGMDGIKTGYIDDAGFNLAASAERNGRRLIGVVFGGKTARSRNAHMARILNDSFQILATRRERNSTIAGTTPRTPGS